MTWGTLNTVDRNGFSGAVVFAFDDVLDTTVPVFSALHPLPALLPVNAGLVGQGDRVGWDIIEQMAAGGWEVVNHADTHADLTAISSAQLDDEIGQGRDTLTGRGFGTAADHFVVPFHTTSETVRARLSSAGYLTVRDRSTSTVENFHIARHGFGTWGSVLFTGADQATGLIDTAMAQRDVLLLHTHDTDANLWRQIRDHVVTNGWEDRVMTMSRLVDTLTFAGLLS